MEEPTTIYVSCVLDSDQDQHALLSNIISGNKKHSNTGENNANCNRGELNIIEQQSEKNWHFKQAR